MIRSLFQNRTFTTLYAAQTVNLLGDALTWVALALLSYELAGPQGGSALLATALTLRVTAFVLVSPWAGVLADRIDRKKNSAHHPSLSSRIHVNAAIYSAILAAFGDRLFS